MAQLVFDQSARVGEWVAERIGQTGSWGDFYAMGIEKDGQIIAGVVFHNYNGANAVCHVAVDKPTKLLVPFLHHLADYAFNHCKLKRLTGMVPTDKPGVIAFDKHLGFEEEFVMKDGAPGADIMVLVMWPDKCRWLRKE
jgi:RimJ/RimL family protein N-acetyltransferase